MSKIFRVPMQKGTTLFPHVTQQPTKVVVVGARPGSPEHEILLSSFSGQLQQFHAKHQQMYALSTSPVYKKQVDFGDARMTYTNIHGQETLALEVPPSTMAKVRGEVAAVLRPIYDFELGGYVFFEINRTVGQTFPVTFAFRLNGVVLFSYTFNDTRDNSFWGVVLFGGNALKYHSTQDNRNEVTQNFIGYPSPKYLDKNYVAGALSFDDGGLMTLPYYDIFKLAAGVLGSHNMSLWDGANTPLLLDGPTPSNRFIGGGVVNYTDISKSPLKSRGKNSFTVSTSSSAMLDGWVEAEFFSRSTRRVEKSWRYSAAEASALYVNDQPTYVYANFTNQVNINLIGPYMSYGQWYGAENTIGGMIAQPTASTPGNYVSDPATGGPSELILDLSK